MFTSYQEEKIMTSNGNIYLLQYGSFINKEVMNENIKKLDNYLIYEHDSKYYVHIGVFTKLNTALKMQKFFENNNIYTYIKNDYISDSNLVKKIDQLDNEIYETKKDSEIKNKNNKILELVKNSVS